jgi:hypothetical protein
MAQRSSGYLHLLESDVIWQSNAGKKGGFDGHGIDPLNLGQAGLNQSAVIDDSLRDDGIRRASIPNSNELFRRGLGLVCGIECCAHVTWRLQYPQKTERNL